ncbi:MAG: HEPN domain-containing protein [Candidatus Aenigmarchaeota archaeon]|nr:HEPN domain-containing protein [Candidatus Aenigmarchaeota archaeon]MDW8160392.1 HEPN domain-containing protein [Candidatus Aenigmarchaeota archaeon]
MRKEAENWFKQSKADLKTAEDCFKDKNYYAVAFFCQQAVEKSLKGLFIVKKRDYPIKTHNLLELAKELSLPDEIVKIARERSS